MKSLTYTYDNNDNIVAIHGCKVLKACNKPLIEWEVECEYQKQIRNQLINIF